LVLRPQKRAVLRIMNQVKKYRKHVASLPNKSTALKYGRCLELNVFNGSVKIKNPG
jgi:hypothetical protein